MPIQADPSNLSNAFNAIRGAVQDTAESVFREVSPVLQEAKKYGELGKGFSPPHGGFAGALKGIGETVLKGVGGVAGGSGGLLGGAAGGMAKGIGEILGGGMKANGGSGGFASGLQGVGDSILKGVGGVVGGSGGLLGGGISDMVDPSKFKREIDDAMRVFGSVKPHLQVMRQSSLDYAKILREMEIARAAAREMKSDAARQAQGMMEEALKEARGVAGQARSQYFQYRELYEDFRKSPSSSFGKLVSQAEKVLVKSPLGRGILDAGKVTGQGVVSEGLALAGSAVSAYKEYHGGSSSSPLGTMASIAASAISGASGPVGTVNGALGQISAYAGKKLGEFGAEQAKKLQNTPEGATVTQFADGVADNVNTLAKSITSLDADPLNDLHARNMEGKNGRIVQNYAKFGQKVADKVQGVGQKVADAAQGVGQKVADLPINKVPSLKASLEADVTTVLKGEPPDFQHSRVWWDAAKDTAVGGANAAAGVAKDVVGTARGAAKDVANTAKEIGGSIFGGLKQAVSDGAALF